ncbi:Aminopeptidase N [Trichostrongylus colubriformis]|uniref:Aminopeptidase n=1 Tax=Trichostrongylus colubriformis TaxID=6319 RepID=A0AAN8EY80_TRICO
MDQSWRGSRERATTASPSVKKRMASRWATRSMGKSTPLTSLLTIFVFAAAIGVSIGLTTGKGNDTSHGGNKASKDHHSPSEEQLRLPTNIKPLIYNLTMKTYLPNYVKFPSNKSFTFDGQVDISMVVVEPTESIVLNARNITVIRKECEVFLENKKVDIKKVVEHESLEKLEFVLQKKLKKDQKILLKVKYIGLITDDLAGLYRTKYTGADGKVRYAATTQMQPSDARRMVPCLDEPSYKANWTVTLIHPKGTKAIANGIEKSTKANGDWITTKFETTPKMSSYLLAVLISEFEFVEGKTKTDVRFRIWARPEAKTMTQYAKDAGIRCLEFYEDFFGIRFPLPKQDMAALPDFAAGAMENWGLITYRETALLYDEKFYGPLDKKRVALIVAHELAHQWFGNLVTLKWWDNLWLNEGFASYVEYIGMNAISHGNMRAEDYFLVDAFRGGLKADALASNHPLSFKIGKATEVSEAFDPITYKKGASVIKMLQAVVGEANFKKAINHYLTKFAYGNAEAKDLWQAFDETVKGVKGPGGGPLKVSEFAPQWTTQMGFPLITVETFNSTALKVTQKRFKLNKKALELKKYRNPKYGFKWDVPLWYQEGKEVKKTWLTRDKPLYLHISDPKTSVVVNADRYAFCRQNYDADGWNKIIKQLHGNHEVYSPRTRNAILSDAFAAASIGELDYVTVYRILGYSKKEKEYLPWSAIIDGIKNVVRYFGNEPESQSAKAYMRKILKPIYDHSSIEYLTKNYKNGKLFFENNLQQAVIDEYCKLGSEDCMGKLKKLFDQEVMKKCKDGQGATDCVSIAAPIRKSVYCYGVKKGGQEAFEKVVWLYRAEKVQLEKERLRRALGCHNDIKSLKMLLLLALDRNSTFVRLQDASKVFKIIAKNPISQDFMLDFVIQRWEQILKSFSVRHKALKDVIEACASGIRSRAQIDQLRNLQKTGRDAHRKSYCARYKAVFVRNCNSLSVLKVGIFVG